MSTLPDSFASNLPDGWTVSFAGRNPASCGIPSPFLVALADLVDSYDPATQRVTSVAMNHALRVLGRAPSTQEGAS